MGSGNDTVVAGVRESAGQAIRPVEYRGEDGFDTVAYDRATSGVSVDMADGVAGDGRAGDRENVVADFEFLIGSGFRDTLLGTPAADGISGGAERDVIAGGAGDDVFNSGVKGGADDYHGGPGRDTIEYAGRTQPLRVQLDNVATDGEAGEFDNVRSNVENVNGGSGADTLDSFGVFSRLEGRGGVDTLNGGDGPDTLIGCETVSVGVLRLAPKAIDAEAGRPARLKLSWRHPDGWRKLRKVELRLTRDGVAVGTIAIRPRGGRIEADGVARVARRATRITRRGTLVTARLAVRIDASMAGERLGLEVEATDRTGRRQLDRGAGTIRVAG